MKGLRFLRTRSVLVLDNLSLAGPRAWLCVRGDESTGKTTLLRLLAGELTAQAGSIMLQGVDLNQAAKASATRVFWADRDPARWDPPTARVGSTACRALYLWDAAALVEYIDGFSLHEHLDKPFMPCLPAASARCHGRGLGVEPLT